LGLVGPNNIKLDRYGPDVGVNFSLVLSVDILYIKCTIS